MNKYIGTFILFFCFTPFALSMQVCDTIPKDNKDSLVKVCKDPTDLVIFIDQKKYSYNIEETRIHFQEMVGDWLNTTDFPQEYLCDSVIQYWLSVPEANPSATQGRLVIKNSFNNFLSYISLDSSEWLVDSSTIGILGSKNYPDYLGHLVNDVLVKAKKNVSQRQLDTYLKNYKLKDGILSTGRWYIYDAPAFHELIIRDRIEKDPFSYPFVDGIEINSSFEWISNRGIAIDFNWQCEA